MTGEKVTPPQGSALRRRAEEIFRKKTARMPENVEALSSGEVRQLVHDLQVHQIELEMQNEELRRAQAELEAARLRYFDLYDLAPVGYFTLSEKGLILEANLTAANMLGMVRSSLVKQRLTSFIIPEDQDIYYRHRKLLFETGAPQICELRLVKKDGAQFWVRMDATMAQDADGAPICRTVMIDITERKRYQENVEYFAIHDQLTGLLNRHFLEDMLNRTIARAKRGVVSSLLYMDLDDFKEVNDKVGHSAGDEVLIALAGLMKTAMRMEDIVFRLGGDEFAVLLDGMDTKEALSAAERLRVAIEGHRFELEGRVFPLSLSIGLIEIDGALTMRELLSESDAAMYRAKGQGKNKVVIAF
ncbi:MAG: sensor domain-containing diguanylate cyclase [Pseudomonadota bacterium]